MQAAFDRHDVRNHAAVGTDLYEGLSPHMNVDEIQGYNGVREENNSPYLGPKDHS